MKGNISFVAFVLLIPSLGFCDVTTLCGASDANKILVDFSKDKPQIKALGARVSTGKGLRVSANRCHGLACHVQIGDEEKVLVPICRSRPPSL